MLLATLTLAFPASAHTVDSRLGDFYGGMLHPLTALEHVLPFFAVGLLAGQQGERAARWLVLVFPLALLAGAGLATVTAAIPFTRPLNAASLVMRAGGCRRPC